MNFMYLSETSQTLIRTKKSFVKVASIPLPKTILKTWFRALKNLAKVKVKPHLFLLLINLIRFSSNSQYTSKVHSIIAKTERFIFTLTLPDIDFIRFLFLRFFSLRKKYRHEGVKCSFEEGDWLNFPRKNTSFEY